MSETHPAAAAEIAKDGVARLSEGATHSLMDAFLGSGGGTEPVTELLDDSLSKYAPAVGAVEAPHISAMTKVKVRRK